MADLSISVLITRDELSLADLQANTSGGVSSGYKIIRDSMGPGEVTWRRTTADSPWVEGRGLVHAVKDVVSSPMGIRVLGSTQSDLATKTRALLRAFEQFTYSITVTIAGETQGVWACEPADVIYGAGGIYQDFHIRAMQQEVYFVIPRDPTVSSGVI